MWPAREHAIFPNTSQFGVIRELGSDEFRLTKGQCQHVVTDTLAFVTYNRGGVFQTDRHTQYPTTDIDIIKVMDNVRGMNLTRMAMPILAAIRKHFKIPDSMEPVLADYFFAVYKPEAQNSLDRHTDGSIISFVINLTDPESYVGGTLIAGVDQIGAKTNEVRLNQGQAVIMAGGLIAHKVTPVIHGTRFVLTGFVELRYHQIVPCIVVKEWCSRFQAECQKLNDRKKESCAKMITDIPAELAHLDSKM